MDLLTIVLFFCYCWGFGYSLSFFAKQPDNIIEASVMRLGIGLAAFPLVAVLLNLLHVPVDWRIMFALAAIVPVIMFFRTKSFQRPRLTKSTLYALGAIVIFLISLFVYEKGAFAYPYMEDDDSWTHAVAVKYIAMEKTLDEPPGQEFLYYLDPYPPGYDSIMGVLHQTSPSIMWTLKFFNSLIVSLGILFFYFMARYMTNSYQKALFATFVLASIPGYLSHFIWSHALIPTLFFVVIYCLERIKHDKLWRYTSMPVLAGIILTQPSQTVKVLILLGAYFIVKSLYQKKISWDILISISGALALSLFWWFNRFASMFSFNLSHAREQAATAPANLVVRVLSGIRKTFPNYSGTATRPYSFNDFFIAHKQNMINNPIGIGIAVSLLVIIALIVIIARNKEMLDRKNEWISVSALWFIITYLLVNSMTLNLPIGIFAFRAWMLLAVPSALLATAGLWYLIGLLRRNSVPNMIIVVFLLIVIGGIYLTSTVQKIAVNTAQWPPGMAWTSMQELQGYLWLTTLPANSKVFDLGSESFVIGFDKYQCAWCPDEKKFKSDLYNLNSSGIHAWLKQRGYEYLIVGGMTYNYVRDFTDKNTTLIQPKINELIRSQLFVPARQTEGMIALRIR